LQAFSQILSTQLTYLKGVGPAKADLLGKELDMFTFKDLLCHFPFRYVDRTKLKTIAEITAESQYVQIKGTLTSVSIVGQKFKKRLTGRFKDHTGSVELVWFKGVSFLEKSLRTGQEYVLFGKPTLFNRKLNFSHPELTLVTIGMEDQQSLGYQAVYHSTEHLNKKGLDSKGILKLQKKLFTLINPKDIIEYYPKDILDTYKFISRFEAFKQIHFPEDDQSLKKAQYRLKFEELFFIQMKLGLMKTKRKLELPGFVFEKVGATFNKYYNDVLSFELTNAQKRVIKEIRYDVKTQKHMNRLVQGDVGSGKTVVAIMAMLLAIDNGFQVCMMAPTEILAQQHYKEIERDLRKVGLNVAILTGSIKGKKRKETLKLLAEGLLHVIVGTHALLEDPVVFKNIGLAVIDEQHRFGVAQRAKLWKKNSIPPHILVMTATPIPRTLAMTVYGDLDVSVIDEMPPGRKEIITKHYFDSSRLKIFKFLQDEIDKGRQAYIVYPLIEESETLDLKDLMDGYESIQRAYPNCQISIVNGRMKPADKEYEMQRFIKHETQIMVATTVIEVGVNVPNASIMVIENAERFGLAQLHQLRGRVGRGSDQSYCILVSGNKLSADGKTRLKTMVESSNGFEIAEVDLKLRGPGNIEGTQQSGIANLKLASIIHDQQILLLARQAAFDLLRKDPKLDNEENRYLKYVMDSNTGKNKIGWSQIS